VGKDGTLKKCKCNLFISNGGRFNVYFEETTSQIGLNDGNFHSIREMKGVAPTVQIVNEGVYLEACFVNIGEKWHRDSLIFYVD
jgi:hypothetical protein